MGLLVHKHGKPYNAGVHFAFRQANTVEERRQLEAERANGGPDWQRYRKLSPDILKGLFPTQGPPPAPPLQTADGMVVGAAASLGDAAGDGDSGDDGKPKLHNDAESPPLYVAVQGWSHHRPNDSTIGFRPRGANGELGVAAAVEAEAGRMVGIGGGVETAGGAAGSEGLAERVRERAFFFT